MEISTNAYLFADAIYNYINSKANSNSNNNSEKDILSTIKTHFANKPESEVFFKLSILLSYVKPHPNFFASTVYTYVNYDEISKGSSPFILSQEHYEYYILRDIYNAFEKKGKDEILFVSRVLFD